MDVKIWNEPPKSSGIEAARQAGARSPVEGGFEDATKDDRGRLAATAPIVVIAPGEGHRVLAPRAVVATNADFVAPTETRFGFRTDVHGRFAAAEGCAAGIERVVAGVAGHRKG